MAEMKKTEKFRLEELRDEDKKLSEKEMKQVIGGAGALNRTGAAHKAVSKGNRQASGGSLA
ncbi:TIGR04149 family rSAM-modified RiPP [Cohnella lupini]|uniref:Bacteriocin-like protein/natural product n=1 Tax=Cohnella lupini TaxID=1294267 RepID=A0A3D9I1V3_9BACL|nr:TIGR04149 family rSAM-modified RiPP [Cohnella lupini]RED55136.1 bacteriocin-like protein/natural product precursor [Cohnella lupini]